MAAHVFAESVDVLHRRVYYWRERRSGDASITQRWIERSNLTDRLASVRGIADFLVQNAPSLKAEFDKYTLDVDLRTLFKALHNAPEEERPALIELAAGYLDSVTPSVYADTDPYLRLCCHLALNRMVPELMELVADEPPVVHRLHHGHYLDLPFIGDKRLGIPDEIYAADDLIELHSRIDDVAWQDGRLRMEGHAYIRCVPMGPDSHIRVSLWHERTGTEVEVPVTRVVRPDVTVESRQTAVSYDHSGFVVEVDPAQLKSGRWSTGLGSWSWRIQVRAGGQKRSNVVKYMAEGRGWWLDPAVIGSVWARHTNVGGGALGLQINEPGAILTGLRQDGGVIQLNGRFTRTDTDAAVARLVLTRDDSEEVQVPVSIGPEGPGGRTFHCRVPLTALVTPLDVIHRETHALTIGEGMRYEVRLVVSDQIRSPIAIPAGMEHGLYTLGDREIRLTATRYGNLTVAERVARPTVTSWGTDGGRLTIAGEYRGPRMDALVLRRHDPRIDVPVPLTWTGTRFAGSFEPPEVQDTWSLLAETDVGDVSVVADRNLLAAGRPVVGWAALGAHKGDSLVVRVKFDPVSD